MGKKLTENPNWRLEDQDWWKRYSVMVNTAEQMGVEPNAEMWEAIQYDFPELFNDDPEEGTQAWNTFMDMEIDSCDEKVQAPTVEQKPVEIPTGNACFGGSGVYYGSYSSGEYYGSYGSGEYYGSYGSGEYYGSYGSGEHYGSYGSGEYYGSYGSGEYYGSYGSGEYYGSYGSGEYYGSYGSGEYYGSYGSGEYYGSEGSNVEATRRPAAPKYRGEIYYGPYKNAGHYRKDADKKNGVMGYGIDLI